MSPVKGSRADFYCSSQLVDPPQKRDARGGRASRLSQICHEGNEKEKGEKKKKKTRKNTKTKEGGGKKKGKERKGKSIERRNEEMAESGERSIDRCQLERLDRHSNSIRIATGGGTNNLQPWTGTRAWRTENGLEVRRRTVINPHTVGNNGG